MTTQVPTRHIIAQSKRPARMSCILAAARELEWALQATLVVEKQRHLAAARKLLAAVEGEWK